MHKYIKCINTSVHIHVTIKTSDYLSCNCILHYFSIYLFLPVFSLHILSLATLDEQEAAAQKQTISIFVSYICSLLLCKEHFFKVKVVWRVSGDILKVIFNQNITILCETNVRLLTGRLQSFYSLKHTILSLQSTTVDYTFRSSSIQPTTNEQNQVPNLFFFIFQ